MVESSSSSTTTTAAAPPPPAPAPAAAAAADPPPPRKKRPRPNRWGDAPAPPAASSATTTTTSTSAQGRDGAAPPAGGQTRRRQPKRSRFSSSAPPPGGAPEAPAVPPPSSVGGGVVSAAAPADDGGGTKAAALQRSIAARLAALKRKRGGPAVVLPGGAPSSSAAAAAAAAAVPPPATTKMARVYDPFAISTKKPTAEDEERARDRLNPYLSTYRDNLAPSAPDAADAEGGGGGGEEDGGAAVVAGEVGEGEVLLDARLAGGRSEKRRARYKPLRFVEPGTIVEIAERKRERAANAAKSGFASGRKAGTYVRSAGMARVSADEVLRDDRAVAVVIVGEGGVEKGGVAVSVGPLPLRADEDPSNPPPLAVEWWDAELLPSKLKRELAAREKRAMAAQAKKSMELVDAASAAILGPAASSAAAAAATAADGDDGAAIGGGDAVIGGGGADDGASGEGESPATGAATAAAAEVSAPSSDARMLDRCHRHADISHSKTSTLVQHPAPVEKPAPPPPPPVASDATAPQPKKREAVLHLTKKEMKRQRKLRRAERRRESQDRQAAGLEPPPEPRLTLSNFMRVLGDQAVVDPSRMEAAVLEQVRSRKNRHERMNEERKLTPERRRAKRARKLAEDTTGGVSVALFYVRDASHRYHRTKIDLNAQQNGITGGVVECDDPGMALVVAEGGPRAVGRYVRLMTVRMRWRGENFPDEGDEEEEEGHDGGGGGGGEGGGGGDEEMGEGGDAYGGGGGGGDGDGEGKTTQQKFNPQNVCELVWTGMSVRRMFNSFVFQSCPTAEVARKVLEAKGVAHYWDQVLAVHERRCGADGVGGGGGGGGDGGAAFNLKLGGGNGGGGGGGGDGGARSDDEVN